MLLAELHELGLAGHCTVRIHDFAYDASGLQAGQPSKVNGSFGLAGTDKNSAVAGS